MRTSRIPMLIAGLALWAGQALAQPTPATRIRQMGFTTWLTRMLGLASRAWRCSATSAPHCWRPMTRISMPILRTFAPPHMCSVKPRNRFARLALAASPTSAAWLGVLGIALVGIGLVVRKVAPRFLWIPGGAILLGVALIALTVSNATAAVATNARGGRPGRPDTCARIPGTDGRHGICIAGSGQRHDDGGA